VTHYARVAKPFHKSRSHLKILSARRVTQSKFQIEDPQTSGDTAQNLAVRVTWRLRSIYSCITPYFSGSHSCSLEEYIYKATTHELA